MALVSKIFDMLNEMDMSLGYDKHDTNVKKPFTVTTDRQEELFLNFID